MFHILQRVPFQKSMLGTLYNLHLPAAPHIVIQQNYTTWPCPTTSSHESLPSSHAPRPPPAAAAAPGSCCSCAPAGPLRVAAQLAAAGRTSRPGRVFRRCCSPSWAPAGQSGFHAAADRQAEPMLASVLVSWQMVCDACPSRKSPRDTRGGFFFPHRQALIGSQRLC